MRRSAFTVVELLIVVAIIGILLAMLMPLMYRAKNYAKRAVCNTKMWNLTKAYITYAADHDGFLVSSYTTTGLRGLEGHKQPGWVGNGPGPEPVKQGGLWPYLNDLRAYKCTNPINPDYESSYSINGLLNGERTRRAYRGAYTTSEIVRPAKNFVFIEEDDWRRYNMNSWYLKSQDSWVDYVAGNHAQKRDEEGNWFAGDHLTFMDGHTEFWTWKDPDTLRIPYVVEKFGMPDPGSVDLRRIFEVFQPREDIR